MAACQGLVQCAQVLAWGCSLHLEGEPSVQLHLQGAGMLSKGTAAGSQTVGVHQFLA